MDDQQHVRITDEGVRDGQLFARRITRGVLSSNGYILAQGHYNVHQKWVCYQAMGIFWLRDIIMCTKNVICNL